jgi:hypothetical protein
MTLFFAGCRLSGQEADFWAFDKARESGFEKL